MTNQEKLRRIMVDPILWIETFVNIVDKKGQLVPFKFNPQQKYIMRNKGKFNITLKSRQLGITSAALSYSLYLAITKLMIKERTIKGLRADIQKLESENAYLKQNEKAVQEAKLQYQSALAEIKEIKDKYNATLAEIEEMKKAYKKEMDKLMSRIRRGK